MTTATQAFINQLTASQQTSLLAGLRRREVRRNTEDALLIGDLFATHLRNLNRRDDAEQVRAILNSLRGEAA